MVSLDKLESMRPECNVFMAPAWLLAWEKTSKMDLALNELADFTRWVVSEGLLREPFILVDVGVQGGETNAGSRWGIASSCTASILSRRWCAS